MRNVINLKRRSANLISLLTESFAPTRFYRFLIFNMLACSAALNSLALPVASQEQMLLVVGAGGEPVYAEQFITSAEQWRQMTAVNDFEMFYIGPAGNDLSPLADPNAKNDKQKVENLISQLNDSSDTLWIVMLGHGTFQQGIANFNLEGPDISADEMADLLKPLQRPLILIHAFSSSGPWLGKLSKPGRVIITATRSGDEQNYSRFGSFLARSIHNPDSDLDHDLNLSLLEAYLKAASDTKQFYESEGRLQTEHALLDDNGDAAGTPPEFFRGVRVVKQAAEAKQADGDVAIKAMVLKNDQLQTLSPEQQSEIAAIEEQIRELRTKKNQLSEDQYFQQLEPLLVRLAKIELQPQTTN